MTVGAARHWAVLVLVLAALVAGAATAFGFEFARESHGHEEAAGAEHAEDEKAMGEAEEETHKAEEGAGEGAEEGHEADEEDGAGMVVSAILIGLAGAALAPFTGLVARRREGVPAADAASDATSALQLASLSMGAAVVHFAVIAQHLDEWWLTGLFFIAVAVFQLLWALLVVLRPSALVYAAGAVVNALVVVTWIVSRTTGVPVGPEAGEAEPVGFPDVLATAFETLIVVLALALLSQPRERLPGLRSGVAWPLSVTAAALTAFALAVLA